MAENGSISYMVLFGQNMPHILENIFLHLDRQSVENCSEVCHGWKNVLSSDNFKTTWDRLHLTKSQRTWSRSVVLGSGHYQ